MCVTMTGSNAHTAWGWKIGSGDITPKMRFFRARFQTMCDVMEMYDLVFGDFVEGHSLGSDCDLRRPSTQGGDKVSTGVGKIGF